MNGLLKDQIQKLTAIHTLKGWVEVLQWAIFYLNNHHVGKMTPYECLRDAPNRTVTVHIQQEDLTGQLRMDSTSVQLLTGQAGNLAPTTTAIRWTAEGGVKPAAHSSRKGAVQICERNNSADTKVSEEGGGGGAPGARAGIPLQLVVKTMVRQDVPLQPMEVHGGADMHLKPVEDPTPEQLDAPEGGCDPVESPCWSRFSDRTCDPMGDPRWSSPFLKDRTPWKGHMERTHTGAVREELQPMGRTHVGEVHGGLSPAKQPQLSQPVLIGEVFHPSDRFCGPPLDPCQQVHVFPVLRTPELDAGLQVGSHQRGVEGQNHLPRPAGHASFDAAQDTVGFLGCERTLPAHVQLFIHQYPQVLLLRAALNPFIPQPVLVPGVALTQVQDLALGKVEPHEVHMGPLLELVQVPLNGIPSFWRVNSTTQLGVICKLAEGALDPTVNVIDEDIKQYWSQYRPLRDTTPRGPKLNTVFEVRPHQCRVQEHNHFPSPAGHAIFDTSQDAIGFLGHLGTLLAHIQAAVNQHPQVLFCQAAFQPLFPKPVALHGVVLFQVQDLALSLVEPHTIDLGPSIQPVQIAL
ncbi:hypothetical protein QYF61_008818 [Mycteria americana]|uniref:Uncharacterized protein n=1 Tax=Mycteria americana TaxID=33587 RepID=A0AAN7NGE0_MYCAM|nr:hypothetical protein QYF61_008818 [Mycteria americana]